jgi:glyceraldehyde 3-phosphate dehydrogenase
VFGKYPGEVSSKDGAITVDGKDIKVFSERDPGAIPWKDCGVDIVIESTGLFTDATKAAAHLKGGAKRVIISAPAKNEDVTIVMGVNESAYDPAKHKVISNASCTTNGIAPAVKVLNDSFGLAKGLMTTIHSYTNDQVVLDTFHKDKRRARAAGLNMIPTTTGAAKAVTQVIPSLAARYTAWPSAYQPRTYRSSTSSATWRRTRPWKKLTAPSKPPLTAAQGHPEFCEEELVSMDFKGNPHSSIIDAPVPWSSAATW